MSDPTRQNRLDEEESPYLRQHADNPVHWQPWDEDALEAAHERDAPIFLSIGYSACHWCHVMEEESFEDEEVAELLNENFVPIKVDREERPDIDTIYMSICQQVTGGGGWPLSAWLTPDGKPFYVGTYFPKHSRQGRPGFIDLLENISGSWRTDRDEMENRAEQWTNAIEGELESTPEAGDAPDAELLRNAASQIVRSADRDFGGFGQQGPKFPQPAQLDVLFRALDRTGANQFADVAVETLDAMANGGLYDHVGGGFHRYATDRQWTVPHFEKMLYDNAELSRAYLAGYQVTGNERYANVVRETFAFLDREMRHPEGGFYSTLDARSEDQEGESEEGTFYVWTPEEIHDAVEVETAADLFCDRYGITKSGNFEGKTVLTLNGSVPELAEEYDLHESEVRELLDDARRQVFEAREERERPPRDEKILAGWNGLLISALAEGGLMLESEYAELAESALDFVRENHWDGDEQTLSRRFKGASECDSEARETQSHGGAVGIDGYLEDYAFLARGAFDLFQATGDPDHLGFALNLARAIEREFWDDERGTLYFTPESGERLVARPQELADQSTPSSLGVATDVLLVLSEFAPHDRFSDVAESVLETHSKTIESNPFQYATLALAADRHATGSLELTVAADELPAEWRERLAETFLPTRILAHRPPTEDGLAEWCEKLELDEVPPIWANRESEAEDEPTLYVCRSFTCSPPVTDIDAGLEWAADLAPE
ncbi:thioredoxin domain-containing protein [Haladaptatus pallidirubidus]|uniref:Thioredoxin domain-containing protein n=1 Tax=Haladaptatus pallidirubidus TaxID=1008152 RepID=A0AAV3UCA5_9EURY|nr:thioredoxin domain-containing protein [Haladaptatus pallidirubidus]